MSPEGGAGTGAAWDEAKRIFAAALEHEPAKRAEYLMRMCGGNFDLYREVSSLLDHHDQTNNPLNDPLAMTFGELQRDPLIGKRVGPYQVLRCVGRGGMGVVYLAERADDQFRKR